MWYCFKYEMLFTLVPNMKRSRLNLIIYNYHNWADSSTLIYLDAIISSMDLTCSSVFRIYSCRDPTCCSLGALDGFTLVTYNGTEMVSLEGSTEGTTGCNLEGFLLGDWIGSIYGIELVTDFGNALGF